MLLKAYAFGYDCFHCPESRKRKRQRQRRRQQIGLDVHDASVSVSARLLGGIFVKFFIRETKVVLAGDAKA